MQGFTVRRLLYLMTHNTNALLNTRKCASANMGIDAYFSRWIVGKKLACVGHDGYLEAT